MCVCVCVAVGDASERPEFKAACLADCASRGQSMLALSERSIIPHAERSPRTACEISIWNTTPVTQGEGI